MLTTLTSAVKTADEERQDYNYIFLIFVLLSLHYISDRIYLNFAVGQEKKNTDRKLRAKHDTVRVRPSK